MKKRYKKPPIKSQAKSAEMSKDTQRQYNHTHLRLKSQGDMKK